MALKVIVGFGGRHVATWATISAILAQYRQIASDNGLELPAGGFVLEFDHGQELVAVTFNYKKTGLAESALQTFNDQWLALCLANNIDRHQTYITYYDG